MYRIPSPTNENDASSELKRLFKAVDKMKKTPSTSMEQHVEEWLHEILFDAYGQIEAAFRITSSPIEAIAYLHLIRWVPICGPNEPHKVHPQFAIGRYKADFMVSYGSSNFVIECDGHDFHEKTKKQAAHDKRRDREMTSKGYIVLRFTGSEVWKDPWVITEALDAFLFEESRREG